MSAFQISSEFQRTKLYRGYSSQPSNYIPLKFFNIDTSNYVGNLTSRGGHRPRPGRSQTRCCSSLRARIHDPGYHNREAAPRRQACNVLHTMWKSGRYAVERRGRARGEARRRCEGHARKATRIVTALSLLRTPFARFSCRSANERHSNGISTRSLSISPFSDTFDQSGLLLNAAQLQLATCRHLAPGQSESTSLQPCDFHSFFFTSLTFTSFASSYYFILFILPTVFSFICFSPVVFHATRNFLILFDYHLP